MAVLLVAWPRGGLLREALRLLPDVLRLIRRLADDAIIITAVLRGVVRRAGIDALGAHWPGTDDGFHIFTRLTGLSVTS